MVRRHHSKRGAKERILESADVPCDLVLEPGNARKVWNPRFVVLPILYGLCGAIGTLRLRDKCRELHLLSELYVGKARPGVLGPIGMIFDLFEAYMGCERILTHGVESSDDGTVLG